MKRVFAAAALAFVALTSSGIPSHVAAKSHVATQVPMCWDRWNEYWYPCDWGSPVVSPTP